MLTLRVDPPPPTFQPFVIFCMRLTLYNDNMWSVTDFRGPVKNYLQEVNHTSQEILTVMMLPREVTW